MEARGGEYAAVVLTGGTAERLGGGAKAQLVLGGHTLLEHALAAVRDAVEVVVVGDPVPTSRAVRFTREQPAHSGPAAALLSGRDALQSTAPLLAVLAVDMPLVSPDTFARLVLAAHGRAGAFLADALGHRHLVGVLDVAELDRARPAPTEVPGLPLHRLLARLDVADVPPEGDEAHDVDTWADLAALQQRGTDPTVSGGPQVGA